MSDAGKRCTRCHVEKPHKDFPWSRTDSWVRDERCGPCARAVMAERNAAIADARISGESVRAIAERYLLGEQRVRQIIQREVKRREAADRQAETERARQWRQAQWRAHHLSTGQVVERLVANREALDVIAGRG